MFLGFLFQKARHIVCIKPLFVYLLDSIFHSCFLFAEFIRIIFHVWYVYKTYRNRGGQCTLLIPVFICTVSIVCACVRVCNIHSLLAFSAYVIFCLPYYTIPVMFVYLHSVRHETLTRAKQLVKPKYNRNLFMNAIQNYKAILPVLCVRLESSRYAENEWQAICCESQGYGGSRKSSRNVPTNNVGENQSLYVCS